MAEANIERALNSVLPKTTENTAYRRRLGALIKEAMKGNFSNEDIKEVVNLVPNDTIASQATADGNEDED